MDGYKAAATLSVSRDADKDEIRRAYRARAKQLHPDAGPNGSEAAFVELRQAFEQLMAAATTPCSSPERPRPTRPTPRFEADVSPCRSSRIDVIDTKPRAVRSANDPRSENHERSARGLSFSRHLTATLTAMEATKPPTAVAT